MGLPWTSDRSFAEAAQYNSRKKHTSMPPGGIRTGIANRRVITELHLRPRGNLGETLNCVFYRLLVFKWLSYLKGSDLVVWRQLSAAGRSVWSSFLLQASIHGVLTESWSTVNSATPRWYITDLTWLLAGCVTFLNTQISYTVFACIMRSRDRNDRVVGSPEEYAPLDYTCHIAGGVVTLL